MPFPKMTHEEYIKKAAEVAPQFVVLGTYINSPTKILHRCPCGKEWFAAPNVVLRGRLKSCGHNRPPVTEEDYVKRLAETGTGITLIGPYKSTTRKCRHLCHCGLEFEVCPKNILTKGQKGCGCSLRKHDRDYNKALIDVGSDFEFIGEYVNRVTSVLHRCRHCKEEIYLTPTWAMGGSRCICQKPDRLTEQKYNELLKPLDFEILEPYIKVGAPILHRCNKCMHQWKVRPEQILQGHGCPACAIVRRSHTRESYKQKVNAASVFTIVGPYTNMRVETLHKCRYCGYKLMYRPMAAILNRKCPICLRIRGRGGKVIIKDDTHKKRPNDEKP